ncbi:hypothetical protein A2U01_0040752 [Trifolium medium]|uniref:Uncharacterized protein n=1 Tax=Trifolium medium TaxID=97028 RepID=A0A392Q640_9FABA|nr:hypothetical protein [Trifolium medium]
MPPRARNVDYMGIEFKNEQQRIRFETLSRREITYTRTDVLHDVWDNCVFCHMSKTTGKTTGSQDQYKSTEAI